MSKAQLSNLLRSHPLMMGVIAGLGIFGGAPMVLVSSVIAPDNHILAGALFIGGLLICLGTLMLLDLTDPSPNPWDG